MLCKALKYAALAAGALCLSLPAAQAADVTVGFLGPIVEHGVLDVGGVWRREGGGEGGGEARQS